MSTNIIPFGMPDGTEQFGSAFAVLPNGGTRLVGSIYRHQGYVHAYYYVKLHAGFTLPANAKLRNISAYANGIRRVGTYVDLMNNICALFGVIVIVESDYAGLSDLTEYLQRHIRASFPSMSYELWDIRRYTYVYIKLYTFAIWFKHNRQTRTGRWCYL